MNEPTTTDYKLTTEEAVKMLRNAPVKSRFALHVRVDAPIIGSDNHVFPAGCHSYLNLSRKESVRLAGAMLSDTLEARGGRLPVTLREDAFGRRTYWIG